MVDGHRQQATQPLVALAIQALVITLAQFNISFAFTGDVAVSLYGEANTHPEKLEILIFFSQIPIPELKQLLTLNYPAYFTCVLPTSHMIYHNPTAAAQHGGPGEIDVILTMAPPSLGPYVTMFDGAPAVPYSILILQQLYLWDVLPPEQAERPRAANILNMLQVFRRREDFYHNSAFDEKLHAASVLRVARFFKAHGSYRKEWQRMGLMTPRGPAASQTKQMDGAVVIDEKPPSSQQHQLGSHTIALEVSETFPNSEPQPPDALSHLDSASSSSPLTTLENHAITLSTTGDRPQHLLPRAPETPSVPQPRMEAPPPAQPKPKKAKLSKLQIRRLAAQTAVDILQAHGFPSAVFGSMGCKLYGNERIPNDVDLLILPPPTHTLQGLPPTQESLKELLVNSEPTKFVLRPSRDPQATYRVLYFLSTPDAKPTPHRSTKVDILLPGVMHLPYLPPSLVVWRNNGALGGRIPVVPFSVLLLQKLQGWDDHRKAEEARYKDKAPVDVADLGWMLSTGVRRYLRTADVSGVGKEVQKLWNDRRLFDEEFEEISRVRAQEFCKAYPKWASVFSGLSFSLR